MTLEILNQPLRGALRTVIAAGAIVLGFATTFSHAQTPKDPHPARGSAAG